MKHWYTIIVLLMVIGLLALTACGAATSQPVEPTVATEPTAAPEPTQAVEPTAQAAGPIAAPAGDQVVDIVSQYGVGVFVQPWLEKITAEYEAMFPNVDIQWTWGGAEYMQKVRARIAADDPPDAFWGNTAMTISMAREGVTQPVTQYFDTSNFEGTEKWGDAFMANVLDNLAWVEDGASGPGIYAVPVEFHVAGIFYVDKAFEKAGIAVPEQWTWKEFLGVCQQLKDAGIEPIAQDAYNWYMGWWFEFIAGQVAGQQTLLDTALNKPGTSWIDNPDFLQAAKTEEELIKAGYLMEGFEGSQYPAGQMELTTGRSAMILNGSWIGSELQDGFTEDQELIATFFPVIEGKGTGPVLEAKYNGWHIPAGAKHVEATIHFLKFLTSRAIQEQKIAETAATGILKGLPMPKHARNQDKLMADAKVIVPFWHGLESEAAEWLDGAFHPVHDRFIFGELTAEEFIEELQTSHDAFWAAKQP